MEKEKVGVTKNLNESIIAIRVELQNAKLKKSGKNKFAGFEYFELADFLPKLNELMLKEGVNDIFTIGEEKAKLTLIKKEEKQTYEIPFTMFETPLNKNGTPSMQDIQYLGALNTYYKRYLYLNAFGITDGEIIESLNNEELKATVKKQNKVEPLATPGQITVLNKINDVQKQKICDKYGVKTIDKLTVEQASDIISNIVNNN